MDNIDIIQLREILNDKINEHYNVTKAIDETQFNKVMEFMCKFENKLLGFEKSLNNFDVNYEQDLNLIKKDLELC